MESVYQPEYEYIHEIFIKEIIFDKAVEDDSVTIFGAFHHFLFDELIERDYGCDFSTLIDILLLAKEKGEAIISLIVEKLSQPIEEIPCVVDVENLFGEPLKIEGITLTIYKPKEKNEKGEWETTKDEFYLIDEICDKAVLKESNELHTYLQLLNEAFSYYKQLIAMNFKEKKARKMSGLKDELLFRIAVMNNKFNDAK